MKRELEAMGVLPHSCCPGHDTFACECYNNRRSKKARARDKKIEHQLARTISKRNMKKEFNNLAGWSKIIVKD